MCPYWGCAGVKQGTPDVRCQAIEGPSQAEPVIPTENDLEELFGSTGVLPGWLDALDSLSAPEAAVGGKRRRADEEPLDELGALGLPPLSW